MPVDFWTKAPWNYKQKEQISLLKRLRAQLEPGEEEPPPEEEEALALANIPGRARMFPGQPPVEPSLIRAVRLAQQPTGLFAPKRPMPTTPVQEGFRAGPSPLLETARAIGQTALTAREAIGQRAVEARRGAGVLGREWVTPAFEPFEVAGKEATTSLFNLVRSLQSLAPGGARPQFYQAEGGPPMSAAEVEERLKATGVTPWLTVPVSEALTWLSLPGGVYLPYDAAQLAKLTARLATKGYRLAAKGAGKYGAELLASETGFAKLPGKAGAKAAGKVVPAEASLEQYLRKYPWMADEVARARTETEAAYVADKMKEARASVEELGARLAPGQREIFIKEYRKYNALTEAPTEAKVVPPPAAPAAEAVAPGITRFPKIIRATEKSPQYQPGGKIRFGYDEFVEWPDGERTLLHKEKTASGTIYRTEGRYETAQPNIGATDRQVLLSKISRRWSELQKEVKPAIAKAEPITPTPAAPAAEAGAQKPIVELVVKKEGRTLVSSELDAIDEKLSELGLAQLSGGGLGEHRIFGTEKNLAKAQSILDKYYLRPTGSIKEAPESLRDLLVARGVKTEAVAPGVAKEPWEMPFWEYSKTPEGKGLYNSDIGYQSVIYEHKKTIQQALSEGKPVPPEVLKDYPDLMAKVAKAPTEAIKPSVRPEIPITAERPLVEAPGAISEAEVALSPELEARLRAVPPNRRAGQIAAIEAGPLSAEEKAARIKILQETAPVAEAVAPGVAKQPWEMTRDEFIKVREEQLKTGVEFRSRMSSEQLHRRAIEGHLTNVRLGIEKGAIPDEVMKDYPDLAAAIPKAEAIKPPVEAPGAIPKAEVAPPGAVATPPTPPAGPTVPPAGTVNPLATPGPRAQPIKVPEVRQAPEILAGVRATYPRRLKAPAPQGVKLREARQLQTNAQEVGRNSEAFLLARLTETGSPVELFGIQAGKVTKVGNPNKLNTAWGDVYENYTKYDLTPEQSQLVETFHRIEDGLKAEAARHGVNIAELTPLDALWHYTARKVTGKGAPKADNIIRVSGKSLGGKESFQKQRVFQFMEEGLAKGFTYADPSETMQAIIGGYYRLIGDKMALEHLRPLGLRMAKGQGPRYGELTTRQPGLMGYKFPEEIAREIDDLFTPEKVNRWVNLTAKAFSPFIPLKAALDASWFAIQGALPISHSILKGKPQVAGRVIAGATKALINPKTMNVFRRNHILTYNEALPYNLITGETEFFEALGPLGKKIGQAPVVGRVLARGIKETYGRGAAMFDAASEQYRIIGWETYKDAWVKGGGTLDQLADFLNIMSGTMSSKLAGVSATRQAVERLPAFAPRFYRANFMVLNHLFDGTKTAREVAKGLGALFGLAYLQHITTSLVTDQPLKLDPRPKSLGGNGGEWLTNEVGGQNVGLGGFMLGLGRLMATVGAVAADEPTRLVSLERRANPVLNWLRGKVHPVIGFTNEVATGKDFAGNELRGAKDYMTQIFSLGIPIAIESILFDKPRPGPGAIAVNVAGGRVFPVDLKDAMARSMFEGKDFRDLTPSEMGQLRQTPGWEMLVKEGKMPSETREREETRLDTLKQMETIDRWAKAGVREDNGQAFSMKDWRDEYYKLLTAKAIASETTWRLRGGYEQKPKNENEKARQGYYDTIKKVQDKAKSKGFPVDPQEITDKLDDYLATLTPEREAWVLDQLGASDTPIGREFRKDKRLIKQAYWKPLEGFETQWQGKEIAMNQALIAKAQVPPDLQTFNRISAQYNLKGYARAKKNFRLSLKMQSPELDRLLVKWGYYENYAHPVNKALQRQGAFVGAR